MPTLVRFVYQRNGTNDVFSPQFPTTAGNTLDAVETADGMSTGGAVRWTATLAATEAKDVASFANPTGVSGSLTASEDPDGVDIFGGSDLLDAVGRVEWFATLNSTDNKDIAAFFASNTIVGSLGATEPADSLSIAATGSIYGALSPTEAQDTAAMAGAGGVIGTLAATENTVDVAAMVGNGGVYGSLAATDAPDAASIRAAGVYVGTLAGVEAQDTVAASGVVAHSATLAVTEALDTLGITGVVGQGFLFVTEAADVASIVGLRGDVGTLNANEAPSSSDVAHVVAFIPGTGALSSTDAPDVFAGGGSLVPLPPPSTSPGRRSRILKTVKDGQAKLKAVEQTHYAPVRIVATATDTTIVHPDYELRIDGLATLRASPPGRRMPTARVRPIGVVNPTDEEILRLVVGMSKNTTGQMRR